MEFFLNLAWAALAIAMICAWIRVQDGSDRRRQFIAVLVLIAILLPAISISDDLLAMQTATETDTYQRRQQLVANGAHPLTPQSEAALPAALHPVITLAVLGFSPPPAVFVPSFDPAVPSAIHNRPPPAA